MAAPHAFWVILAGAVPTAFRARHREDLVPTLVQLQRTQSDVSLRWFDRGRVWESPEAARAALLARRRQTKPGREWRPGGTHKDPKARYEQTRDQKRAKWKRQATEGRGPFARPKSPYRKPAGKTGFKPRGPRGPRGPRRT